MVIEKAIAMMPSCMLIGSLRLTSSKTGRSVRKDWPKSARKMPAIHSTYCWGIAVLRLYLYATFARNSGSIAPSSSSDAIRSITSPGRKRTAMKTKSVTKNSVGTSSNTRRMMYVWMARASGLPRRCPQRRASRGGRAFPPGSPTPPCCCVARPRTARPFGRFLLALRRYFSIQTSV